MAIATVSHPQLGGASTIQALFGQCSGGGHRADLASNAIPTCLRFQTYQVGYSSDVMCQQRSSPSSRNGTAWNVRGDVRSQSAFAPESLTTLAHFSVSLAKSLAKSAGEPGSGVPPNSAIRALILGSAKAAFSS